MPNRESITVKLYEAARERYAALGVDTEAALARLAGIPISLHCWQGDDVGGFDNPAGEIGGGLAVTGNYPGKARTPDELRADLEMAFSLIPGRHRLNLHSSYAEILSLSPRRGGVGGGVDRDALEPAHFAGWIDWAKGLGIGMDFNPTCFGHPKAASGWTIASSDRTVAQFWIDHCIACRRIGAAIGQALGTACVTNVWVPDGMKDLPIDRKGPRERLIAALDTIFAETLDPRHNLDSVESKLFGIGSESYVVGSHEFYLGYAITRKKMLCLDSGHFHPTETVSDKLSAIFPWVERMLLHVSRGIRWDSDHVVILTDELAAIGQELVRGDYLDRTHLGLDFFDASINRVAAWVIGTRATQKSLLLAHLEPIDELRILEAAGDYTARLAMLEELKTLPAGAVWDYHCLKSEVPVGPAWLDAVRRYEREVQAKRG
jgi:L-rhamnose isomerase